MVPVVDTLGLMRFDTGQENSRLPLQHPARHVAMSHAPYSTCTSGKDCNAAARTQTSAELLCAPNNAVAGCPLDMRSPVGWVWGMQDNSAMLEPKRCGQL